MTMDGDMQEKPVEGVTQPTLQSNCLIHFFILSRNMMIIATPIKKAALLIFMGFEFNHIRDALIIRATLIKFQMFGLLFMIFPPFA